MSSLTLDEWIIYLLLEGVTSYLQVWQLLGNAREDLAKAVYCRLLQIRTKVMAGYTYQGALPAGSRIDKVLTNDEWFILLLLFGTQNYNAKHVLQRIKADIVFCQTVFDRYVDIHVRYERGWRAHADPSITSPN